MLEPIKLKSQIADYFIDPLASHKCEIEELINDIDDTWGGYEEHIAEKELPGIFYSQVSVHVEKINKILGLTESSLKKQ